MAIPLLDSLDLTDKDITADALLTQRKLANYLVEQRNAHYHFTVKANQPTLLENVALLFQERNPLWYPMLLCALRAGMRQGELIELTPAALDFHGRFIEVSQIVSRNEVTTPTSGKSRRVEMSSQLKDTLQELVSKRRAGALRREVEKPAGERRDAATVADKVMRGWLFSTPVVTRLEPSNLRKVFSKLLADAKLRRIRFHDLRHSFASLLIGRGESLAYIRDQLGHHSIQITVDTYGQLVPGGNRQAVDRLDATQTRPAAQAVTGG